MKSIATKIAVPTAGPTATVKVIGDTTQDIIGVDAAVTMRDIRLTAIITTLTITAATAVSCLEPTGHMGSTSITRTDNSGGGNKSAARQVCQFLQARVPGNGTASRKPHAADH